MVWKEDYNQEGKEKWRKGEMRKLQGKRQRKDRIATYAPSPPKRTNSQHRMSIRGKKHTGEENKASVVLLWPVTGVPQIPNFLRWISKLIQAEHEFADSGGSESPWTSSALLNIPRNLSIITEGLLSTRPNCSNNFNYFP